MTWRTPALRLAALTVYGAMLSLSAPAWPDDWDGVGFLESVRRFDLDRFQPHPPGYPVYVALLRVAAVVAGTPMRACVVVAVAGGVATAALVWDAARERAGERVAWATVAMVAVAPLAWRACSGVGSEAPALACLAGCLWGLAVAPRRPRAGAVALGLGAGLGLGVRLSWAPVYVAAALLAPRGTRGRAWALALGACVAWSAPLVLLVGPAHLRALTTAHFAGHAERWGGTLVTEPGPVRLLWLARDVFVDGLGLGSDALGLTLGAAMAAVGGLGVLAWRQARGWWRALVLVVPYLVWIGVGQNLRDQPRHALPLVALLAAALAGIAARSRPAGVAVGALVVLMAARTALDATTRRAIPPAGAQLVALARAQPAPERLAVFGVSSARFFEVPALDDPSAPLPRGFSAGSLGDVQVRLTRLDVLPSRVWVTSEVDGLTSSPWPLEHLATLCRPPRIDRRSPCLEVFDWKLPYLRP